MKHSLLISCLSHISITLSSNYICCNIDLKSNCLLVLLVLSRYSCRNFLLWYACLTSNFKGFTSPFYFSGSQYFLSILCGTILLFVTYCGLEICLYLLHTSTITYRYYEFIPEEGKLEKTITFCTPRLVFLPTNNTTQWSPIHFLCCRM
jgi:hypothetical protein